MQRLFKRATITNLCSDKSYLCSDKSYLCSDKSYLCSDKLKFCAMIKQNQRDLMQKQ